MGNIRNIPSVKPDTKCYRCSQEEQRAGNRSYYGWEQVEHLIQTVRGSGVSGWGQANSIRNIFARICRKKKYRMYTALYDCLTPEAREILFYGWVPDNYQGRKPEPKPERTSEAGTLAGWV